jgi:hypothetical protein
MDYEKASKITDLVFMITISVLVFMNAILLIAVLGVMSAIILIV